MVSPARRWFEDPAVMFSGIVKSGDHVLEVGPGMGFFTIRLAERVGPTGLVHCVDVQQKMLQQLERRVRRRGLEARVLTRCCKDADLGVSDLTGSIDCAVLIHVLHEVDDPRRTLDQVVATLRPTGQLLLIEPKAHVKPELFEAELEIARALGMSTLEGPAAPSTHRGLAALLTRSTGE